MVTAQHNMQNHKYLYYFVCQEGPVALLPTLFIGIMGNSEEKVCRVCFTKIKDDSCNLVEEIHKEMLEVVVKKMDWDLSVEPVICEKCLTKLNDSFAFKSNCIYVEDFLTPYFKEHHFKDPKEKNGNCKEEFKLDISLNAEQHSCRLCITTIEEKEIRLSVEDQDKFEKYLPEIKACSYLSDEVCSACFKLLHNFFDFCEMCMENDNKLEAYCKTIRRRENRRVALLAFLECTGELETKSEGNVQLGVRQMPDGRYGCPVCSFTTKQLAYLRVHKSTHEKVVDVKLYKCPECPLETKYEDCLKTHIKTKHSLDAEIFECHTCSFKTKHKISLRRHVILHRETNVYKCEKCDLQTKNSSTLKNHVCKAVKQKITYRCELCAYKTYRKRQLKEHSKVHQTPSDAELLKCKVCEFKTKRKSTLRRHEAIHDRVGKKQSIRRCPHCIYETFGLVSLKSHLRKLHNYAKKPTYKEKCLSERAIRHFKCPQCDFAALTGHGLSNHAKTIHGCVKPSYGLKKLKCDLCDYQTNKRSCMNVHQLKHKDVPDEEMHKCDKCNFQSKWASGLRNHQVIHSDVTLKCPKCSFETKHRKTINQHISIRHCFSKKEYKCEKCTFTSKWKASIDNHQIVHGEAALCCTKCDFKTRYPKSLKNHLRDLHKTSTTVKKVAGPKMTLKCQLCPFQTVHQRGLSVHTYTKHTDTTKDVYNCDKCSFSSKKRGYFIAHQIIHRDVPVEDLFSCDFCDFKSKYERSLRNHVSSRHPNECEKDD